MDDVRLCRPKPLNVYRNITNCQLFPCDIVNSLQFCMPLVERVQSENTKQRLLILDKALVVEKKFLPAGASFGIDLFSSNPESFASWCSGVE